MNMPDHFSAQVSEILSFASEEALRLEDRTLDTEHLLMGVIRQGNNTALSSFINADIDLNKLWQEAESASLLRSRSRTRSDFKLPLSRQSRKVIDRAGREARSMQSPWVEAEHLILSLLRHRKNKAARILEQFNVDYEGFLKELSSSRRGY
jgi:ATP-dependent Clp protease ATP-binding subunit ClpC